MNKKVLLGMSGGVDSSVAAILLKEQGYDVIGVTMQLWNADANEDAKKMCDYLGIKHYTFNFEEEFKKYVIQDFICEYGKCRTPNPCIECNRHLKFGAMYKKAQELGCEYIATGHYAKIEYDENYKAFVLKKSNSVKKDQSYVLYTIPKELLDKIIFPLGEFVDKEQIREIARKYKLPVANKPDSEDICFVPDGDYKSFLEKNSCIKSKVGNIVNTQGQILGQHTGLYKYTIGQRKGLGISNPVPLFVIGFNEQKSELIVGEEAEAYTKEFYVDNVNIMQELKEKVIVKTRYSSKESSATLVKEENKIKVILDEPQKAITPGQSAVFYDGDIVLGGGKIV